ncbi:MAG: terminase small subunit, partial [Gammaproteobacteria bacterium]|nr:terminase small subunit [Gammaproteobacteria bacterium]
KADSAEANGPRALKDPHVVEYLEQKRVQAEDKADISEERILKELACLAFLDPADFYQENGDLKSIHDIPEHARRALSGMKITAVLANKDDESLVTNKEIKYNDKKPSLELLMKYKGMLTEKIEHSGGVGGVLLVPGDVSLEEWQKQHSPNQT